MKKTHTSLCMAVVLVLMASVSLFADPKIQRIPIHKGLTCAKCHDEAKFPKKKDGYDAKGPKHKEIAKNKLCAGPKCHK